MPLPTAAELTDPNATNAQMKQRLGQLAENVESKENALARTEKLKTDLVQPGKNLFDKSTKIIDKYINASGAIAPAAGWSISQYIQVEAGQKYTVSAAARRVGLAFYDSNKNYIASSYNALAGTVIVTAPVNAKYLVINVDSTTVVSNNVQVEKGDGATSYEEYKLVVKPEVLPENLNPEILVSKNELVELVEPLTAKDYEILVTSKNLYDQSKKQLNLIVGNNGAIQNSTGWSCTDFIPVTPGEYYTISFSAKRQNLAFYAQKGGVGTTAIEYNTSAANPLTVQAPAGANYLVVNLDSSIINATNVQVEKGQVATPYEPGSTKVKIDSSYLDTNQNLAKNSLVVNGNEVSIAGSINDIPIKINAFLTKVNEAGDPTVFNFAGDYINNILQRSLGDDVAPMRMDGTTIGANHGYQKSNLTLANHEKTVADIGSVWTSGGKQYVIVSIISNNVLSITSRSDNTVFSIGELVHVSGATNTASFTPTATVSDQWYPAIRDRKLTCFIDNVKIDLTQNATHSFKDTVKFLESYSIMKKSDIVEWLISNKGVNHATYNAAPAYTVNFGYTFDHECGCTIYFGGVGRKTVDLVDQMITQSVQLAQGNGVVYNYIPKAAEFTEGGFTYNFSQLENLYTKNPSTPLYLTAARQEAETAPIDRIVMLNAQVGYATGYLPILDAAPNVRLVNASRKYLEIRNGTLKLYPRLIDSASINKINEGDAFAAIAYRKYFKRSTDRTCKYVVRSEYGDYLYLDWHTAKTDEVELPSDLVGREFEIVEKSTNVSLLSKFASNSLLVKINSTKNYGYLVLKFK